MGQKIYALLNKSKNNSIIAFIDAFAYSTIEDRVPRTAGALSYFLILSIFPFLIALLNILNLTPFTNQTTISQITTVLPENISTIIGNFMFEVSASSSATLLSLSIIGGLWSASRAMRQIVRGINDAYSFEDERNFLQLVLIGVLLTIAMIVMIVLILVTTLFSEQITRLVLSQVAIESGTLSAIKMLNFFIPVGYMFLMFLVLYKFSPSAPKDEEIPFTTIIPGAIFSTLAIILGTFLFNIYVKNFSNYSVTYGSLAGIILFLIWLYLFGLIILIGGEINATVYRKTAYGLKWPRKNSVLKKVLLHPKVNS